MFSIFSDFSFEWFCNSDIAVVATCNHSVVFTEAYCSRLFPMKVNAFPRLGMETLHGCYQLETLGLQSRFSFRASNLVL